MSHPQPPQTAQREDQDQRSLWRNRDFLLLWSGQTISTLGTNISRLALPLLVLAFTHSPAQAGLLIAMRELPYLLFSLPAGALVDRWNRKLVMIWCDLVRWLIIGAVPLAFFTGHLTLLLIYLAAFVEGSAYVLFSIAQIAALPQVVSPQHLSQAYALDTTTEYTGTFIGPPLGAFIIGLAPIITLGTMLAYLADSGSYLVSVITLLCIRVSFQLKREEQTRQGLLKEISQGLRFLWKQAKLRFLMLLTTTINFLQAPIDLALIILAQGPLHSSVQTIGILLSAGGVGGILGSLVAPWIRQRLRLGQILIVSLCIWIVAGLLLTIAPSMPILIAGRFLLSVIWPPYGVAVVTERLTLTPVELQGRVNSAFRFLSYGAEPLGSALGGLLLASLAPSLVLGLITAGLALCLLATGRSNLRKA